MYILLDLLLQKKIPAIICIWYVYNTEIFIILLAEFDCFRIQAVLLFTRLLNPEKCELSEFCVQLNKQLDLILKLHIMRQTCFI